MPGAVKSRRVLRVADANLNRASEGLRAAEDVLRFCLDRAALSREARLARHAVRAAGQVLASDVALRRARDARGDVGRRRSTPGTRRGTPGEMLAANLRRAQESVRVLEEVAHIAGRPRAAALFQAVRYRLYTLEQRALAGAGGKTAARPASLAAKSPRRG